MAEGTLNITHTRSGKIHRLQLDAICGTASPSLGYFEDHDIYPIVRGRLIQTVYDTGKTATPTASLYIKVKNDTGVDLLGGACASGNIAMGTPRIVYPWDNATASNVIEPLVDGVLTLDIDNNIVAGSTLSVYLYIQEVYK